MSSVEVRPGLWGTLDSKLGAPAEEVEDIWAHLSSMVDPGDFRPKLAGDVEIKEFKLRWGNDYAMIANPRDLLHYRLTPREAELVKLMDGTRTVKELVFHRFEESGDLELAEVADLVRELRVGSFLDHPFLNVDEAVGRAMNPMPLFRQKARQFGRELSIDWKNADRLVRWGYEHGLKWFFNRWISLLGLIFAVVGFGAFLSIAHSHRFSLSGKSLALGFLILMGLNYLLTFMHELGHALVLIRAGRRIKGAGFMIYFGSPAFFVDSSDGLMMDRGQRITQSFAGPYAEMILAGAAAIAVWVFPGAGISEVLYKFVVLNYLVLFLNLIPLLELDGYWILSDLIQVPDLRPMSLAFIRHDLWRKLRHRTRLNKQEVGLAGYGLLGVAFTIFSFYTAYFFWKQIFGGLVSRLWNGGLVTRILLVALGLFVLGPVIRGAIAAARSVGRRLRALGHRVQFRLETKWRVEAAHLIDALPLFADVPAEVLSDLAGRVRLRTLGRGQPVVRQGERPEAFYVVRRGVVQVVEEDPDNGGERPLRVLGRGESFGELALLEGRPRTATVRAVEESEVFEVDKGSFDRLLADMVVARPEFGPTLQAAAELRGLSCFSHLEPDELADLLERGSWETIAPGEAIVEQGEIGDAFYAIGSGQVEVIQDGSPVRTMGPGGYFGEIALLLDVPRTATVVARTSVRAFRLDREGFDRVVADAFRKGTLNPAVPQERTWQH